MCIARNKVSVSGKVNVWNYWCVNYFLQLNLIQIAKRGKWKVGDESDHKVLTVLQIIRRTLGDIK